jgi:hypothetical protein
MDGVAHHLQGLKRNHDLVILDEVAGQQQKLCGFHCASLRFKFAISPERCGVNKNLALGTITAA